MGLIGTIIAGALGDHLGVVLVLNIQGGGYILAGVLALALLGGSLATRAALSAGEKIGIPSRIEGAAESS